MIDPFDTDNTPVFKFAVCRDLDDSFLPTKAEALATGWDVRAAWKDALPKTLKINQAVKIPLGIRCFAPAGWWLELKPRSSTFGKKNLHCLIGTIDESYSGELLLAVQYFPAPEDADKTALDRKELVIDFGEALGQLIPVERQEMKVVRITEEELDALVAERKDTRGSGGFGSTGK